MALLRGFPVDNNILKVRDMIIDDKEFTDFYGINPKSLTRSQIWDALDGLKVTHREIKPGHEDYESMLDDNI